MHTQSKPRARAFSRCGERDKEPTAKEPQNNKILPCPEYYLSNIHCKGHRWVIAALQGGCLLLQVETGRYRLPKTAYLRRTCKLCSFGEVELEFHFVMTCKALDEQRSSFFPCISCLDPSFSYLSTVNKFTYILSANNHCNLIGKHLFKRQPCLNLCCSDEVFGGLFCFLLFTKSLSTVVYSEPVIRLQLQSGM